MQYFIIIIPIILAILDFFWDGRDKNKKGIKQITGVGWFYLFLTGVLIAFMMLGIKDDDKYKGDMKSLAKKNDSTGTVNNSLEKEIYLFNIKSNKTEDSLTKKIDNMGIAMAKQGFEYSAIKNEMIKSDNEKDSLEKQIHEPLLMILNSENPPNPKISEFTDSIFSYIVAIENHSSSNAYSFRPTTFVIGFNDNTYYLGSPKSICPYDYNDIIGSHQLQAYQFYFKNLPKSGYIYLEINYTDFNRINQPPLRKIYEYKIDYLNKNMPEVKSDDLVKIEKYLKSINVW